MKRDNRKNQQNRNTLKRDKLINPEKKNNSTLFIIIAFCLPVILYLQTINFGFTYFDDDSIILKNINFLSDFGNIPKAFLNNQFIDNISSFYRPLGTLSYMMDIQLSGGNNTWMYHLSNILLIGAISCSLFLLLKRFQIPEKLALLSTLIYCVHPLFVSTVAFLPNRAELLQTFFALLSFLFLIDFLQKKKIMYLFFHGGAFTFAVFSKETAVFLPVLFIIYYFSFTTKKQYEIKHLFALILYAISGILWLWIRSKAIGNFVIPKELFGLVPLLLNLRIIPECLTKFFLPFDFAPIPGFSLLKTIIGIAIIILIISIFFINKERLKKEKIFCLAWFFLLMLPPMLYKHPLIDYLDHRFFLPMIGILVFLLFLFPEKWSVKINTKITWGFIILFIFLSSFTFIKTLPYSDSISFYNSAISLNSNSALAYNNRGWVKSKRNNYQGAIEDYSKAIVIYPAYDMAYCNRGIAKLKLSDNLGALADFNISISLNNNNADAYYNRGVAKENTGDNKGAMEDYNKVIAINPSYYKAYYNRGRIKLNMGDNPGAIEDNNKTISIYPIYEKAHNNKGIAMYLTGNFREALNDFNNAIKINPNYFDAYFNRAMTKDTLKDFNGALEDCEIALKLNPNDERVLKLKAKAQQDLKK